jgi:multisubunit Na+/H+ antiporter MnhE subunit
LEISKPVGRFPPVRELGHHALSWIGWWTVSMLLWLAFTTTINKAEATVGFGASIVAATAGEVVRSRVELGFRLRLRWLRHALRLPRAIAADTWTVLAVLTNHVTGHRRVRGVWRAVPFAHGGPDEPEAGARRALVTAGVTMTPNTIVVGIDPDRDELLVHQLASAPADLDRLLGRSEG